MSNISIKFYFNRWKQNSEKKRMFREYDDWCEIHNERLAEEEFAAESGMDSIHWCWNCKYHECDIHQ